jgi:GST-like protein
MSDLSAFPITRKWPPQHPDRLQLYSLPTPNGVKIAVMLEDPNGPDGKPLPLFESGAILIYLADKTGQFMPPTAAGRYETIQWLMFQMAGIGPLFGQLGYFHKFAGREFEDKRPRDHYVEESRRLLGVLDGRLAGRAWIMGDLYTIADMAVFPWIRNLIGYYGAGELVRMGDFPQVTRVFQAFSARPAVIRGIQIPRRQT